MVKVSCFEIICMREKNVHVTARAWNSENNPLASTLFFHHVSSRNQSHIIRLSSTCDHGQDGLIGKALAVCRNTNCRHFHGWVPKEKWLLVICHPPIVNTSLVRGSVSCRPHRFLLGILQEIFELVSVNLHMQQSWFFYRYHLDRFRYDLWISLPHILRQCLNFERVGGESCYSCPN